jgi:hypothetical protein
MVINFTLEVVQEFIGKAQLNSYAGRGKFVVDPERAGFKELIFQDGDFYYRDSFTGWFRSAGSEVVRFKDTPVWVSHYFGGMKDFNKELTHVTFNFLKKVLSVENKGFDSFRGPKYLQLGFWEYRYSQTGSITEFKGEEKILKRKKEVFSQEIMGGLVKQAANAGS